MSMMSGGSPDDRQQQASSLSAGPSTTLVLQTSDINTRTQPLPASTTNGDCKVTRANTMPARRFSKTGNINGAVKTGSNGTTAATMHNPASGGASNTNNAVIVSTVSDVHQADSEDTDAKKEGEGDGGEGVCPLAGGSQVSDLADADRSSNGTASTQQMEDSTASLCTETSKHIFSNPFQDKG